MNALRKAHPGTRFSDAVPTEVPELYEVWMNDTVAYVSSRNPRFFVFGRLFDTRTMRDVTAPRLALQAQGWSGRSARGPGEDIGGDRDGRDVGSDVHGNGRSVARNAAGDNDIDGIETQDKAPFLAVPFHQLPLTDALRTVHGNGDRQLAVFSDPGCAYCQQLEQELARLDNVTIHTFIVPFQGHARPVSIWCAADRERAWRQWMLQGDATAQSSVANCAHPIERNLALARRWQVNATPTLIWNDGQRTVGFVAREEIEARLKVASPMRVPPPAPVPLSETSPASRRETSSLSAPISASVSAPLSSRVPSAQPGTSLEAVHWAERPRLQEDKP